ncbi:uncharacterized protein SAPINGB_P003150 [Magnusiomyces paraingens]|uniref:EKC/KEOPS complex subunit CGI121 n=1 Tax=Magnusiomyces paraingens TaxID=2606893 RepID=A0A5E8BJ44_9ASCO|nr:uncharacterized protein SAPINGB_P003150 [Saprochaete ingens]VVT51600.1 unnamed protein product [Saprochaete ingens]
MHTQDFEVVIKVPQFSNYLILISLFEDVNNASEIRSQLLHGNPQYEYAFVDTTTIMDGLRRFGISDNSRSFFAVKIIKGSTSSDKSDAGNRSLYQPYLDFLIEKVKGRQIQVANLTIEKLSDFKVIKKNYKLSASLIHPTQINTALISAISLRGA